jgi:hypothetical protein
LLWDMKGGKSGVAITRRKEIFNYIVILI